MTSIGGDLRIYSNAYLTSLTGLDNMTFIGGNLWIVKNDVLTSLTGLENLTYAGGLVIGYMGFSSMGNASLTSLTGLNNLIFIGGHLQIAQNNTLPSLTGLDNLISIGGDLIIGNYYGPNGNYALTSLTGLDNVTSIGGALVIAHNLTLTSLMGLDNINAASIDELHIKDNSSLSTCEVQSVCDYLSAPGGTIEIHDNATGCNSQAEVEEACESVAVDKKYFTGKLMIYPNPAQQELNISLAGHTIDEVSIYTLTGQQVMRVRPADGTIDISRLQPGMYIVEAMVENTRIRKKLLVQR